MLPGEKIIKEKVPDFDLLKIDMVESITIYFLYTGEKTKHQNANMKIKFTYQYQKSIYLITLDVIGVKKLTLPELGTNFFELGELDIYPVKNIDDAKYCIEDTLDGIFCYCEDLEFSNIILLEK